MVLDGVKLEEINISESNYTADKFYSMGQKKFAGLHIYQSLFGAKLSTSLDFLEGIQNKSSVKVLIIDVPVLNQQALDILYKFENLSYLSVGTNSKKPMTLIINFKKLRSLTVFGNIKLKNIDSVNLKYLKLINCPTDVISDYCSQIGELILYGCKDVSPLKYMAASDIKKLIITKARSEKLEYIHDLKVLEYLELNYCPNLTDYSEIADCKSLISVHFEGIKNMSDTDTFTQLKNVSSLTLFKCGDIQSLSFLNDMPSLQDFLFTSTNIVDGDLTPCMRLKSAWSSFGKKHYNIDVKDLPHN